MLCLYGFMSDPPRQCLLHCKFTSLRQHTISRQQSGLLILTSHEPASRNSLEGWQTCMLNAEQKRARQPQSVPVWAEQQGHERRIPEEGGPAFRACALCKSFLGERGLPRSLISPPLQTS